MQKRLILFLIIIIHCFTYSQKEEITLISWNIRDFGKTKNGEELNAIAEIIKEADIIAIQEVVSGYGGAQAVAKLTDILNRKGAKWDYVISNPTKSPKYASERYAFIWKTRHIKIKNRGRLVSELDSLIDREPFFLDFYLEEKKFTVLNFHSRPHNKNPEAEITALTNYINGSLKGSVILAGDFNVSEDNLIFNPLKQKDYTSAVTNQKTTLKRYCDGFSYRNYAIDNIFYSKTLTKINSGVIDFVLECSKLEDARKLSDHLPIFLRFHF